MQVEDRVGFLNEDFVEPALIGSGLISAKQQDGLTLGIKGERKAIVVMAVVSSEFLEVGMARFRHGIDVGPSELGAEHFQHPNVSSYRILRVFGQALQPGLKLGRLKNLPCHTCNIS